MDISTKIFRTVIYFIIIECCFDNSAANADEFPHTHAFDIDDLAAVTESTFTETLQTMSGIVDYRIQSGCLIGEYITVEKDMVDMVSKSFATVTGTLLVLQNLLNEVSGHFKSTPCVRNIFNETTCPSDGWRCKSGECITKESFCNGRADCLDRSDESPNCTKEISSSPTSNCSDRFFSCKEDGKCIPGWWECDGVEDCNDGSDEDQCEAPTCSSAQFQCTNVRYCISKAWVCDGHTDCLDGSDEISCSSDDHDQVAVLLSHIIEDKNNISNTCTDSHFLCDDMSMCIPNHWVCDGEETCPDSSDEKNCTTQEPNQLSSTEETKPKNYTSEARDANDLTTVIPFVIEAGDNDICPEKSFFCQKKQMSICLPAQWVCDDFIDCDDGIDESICHPASPFRRTYDVKLKSKGESSSSEGVAPEVHYNPFLGDYINEEDFYFDSNPESNSEPFQDYVDEYVYENTYPNYYVNETKTSASIDENGTFYYGYYDYEADGNFTQTLSSGRSITEAINYSQVPTYSSLAEKAYNAISGLFGSSSTNGTWEDIPNNETITEDLTNTTVSFNVVWRSKPCNRSQFTCKAERRCIPINWRCDGEPDCNNNEDEEDCDQFKCSSNQFRCKTSSTCINKVFKCDGDDDCRDGSDEIDCLQSYNTVPHILLYTTTDGKCKDGWFSCNTTNRETCIPKEWLCDGIVDCINRTDEMSCNATQLNNKDVNQFNKDLTVIDNKFSEISYQSTPANIQWATVKNYSPMNGSDFFKMYPTKHPLPLTELGSNSSSVSKLENSNLDIKNVTDAKNLYLHPLLNTFKKIPIYEAIDRANEHSNDVQSGLPKIPKSVDIQELKENETAKYLEMHGGSKFDQTNNTFSSINLQIKDLKKAYTGTNQSSTDSPTVDNVIGIWNEAPQILNGKLGPEINNFTTQSIIDSTSTTDFSFSTTSLEMARNTSEISFIPTTKSFLETTTEAESVSKAPTNSQLGLTLATESVILQIIPTEEISARNNVKCKDDEIQCNADFKCIPKSWRCDKEKDCSDGQDEHHCPQHVQAECNEDIWFRCKFSSECLNPFWQCDGDKDCSDGSDELNCPTTATTSTTTQMSSLAMRVEFTDPAINGTCSTEHFLCMHTQVCIPGKWQCDGEADCPNGEDEERCPGSELSTGAQFNHSSSISDTKELPCVYDPGYFQCKDEEICFNLSSVCDGSPDCPDRSDEGAGCDLQEDGFLLVSLDKRLEMYTLDVRNILTVHEEKEGIIVGISYDPVDRVVYWTVISKSEKGVFRKSLGSQDKPELFLSSSTKLEGIAVDWLGRNLYIADAAKRRIRVCSLLTTNCTTLLDNVAGPTTLQVDLNERNIYWTDKETPLIEMAGMDGKGRKHLVSENIAWVNGIALDPSNRRIYWMDGNLDTIEYLTMDDHQRQLVTNMDSFHPYSIAVWENKMYWTDLLRKQALVCLDRNCTRSTIFASTAPASPWGISLYHPDLFAGASNFCAGHPCSHMCLLSNSSSTGFSCACPDGMLIANDQKTCY